MFQLPVFYIKEAIALFEESFTAFNKKHNGTRSTWHHMDFQDAINVGVYKYILLFYCIH